jgi:hypothetical protein
MRWNSPTAWVWSAQVVHEPLVSDADFEQVQQLFAGKHHRQISVTTIKRTHHPYQLRGLLFCDLCQHRTQGSWNNDKPHYRCVYPTEYALANHTQHPRCLYVREEQIVPTLDRWLLRAQPVRLLEHGDVAEVAVAVDRGDLDAGDGLRIRARTRTMQVVCPQCTAASATTAAPVGLM